ncbi:MAG: Zinc transporter, inner rane permease protein ZnuB [Cyanobacteria bacterium RYN_339]|nr:Zinc transporter, inner rane permease protein ZnuB [Cyanobacteria bacterium RYN_339]
MADVPTLEMLTSNWELFREPVLVAGAAGAVLGYMGIYIVIRRMVFFAAALSQAAGCGVALAFFAQINLGLTGFLGSPRLWAVGTTALAAWILTVVKENRISREGFLALAYLLGGAGAMLLGTRISQEAHDIQAILFGTAVLVSAEDVHWVLGVGAVVMIWQLWWRRGLLFASLDVEGARIRGLPVQVLDAGLMLMLAVFVSVTTHALGALPVFAFSVLPALAAVTLCKNPTFAFVVATIVGILAGVGGYMLAFFGQFPVGASQATVAAAAVVAALLLRGTLATIARILPSVT